MTIYPEATAPEGASDKITPKSLAMVAKKRPKPAKPAKADKPED